MSVEKRNNMFLIFNFADFQSNSLNLYCDLNLIYFGQTQTLRDEYLDISLIITPTLI